MSFWNLSDTSEKLNNSGEFESGGGDIAPIPKNTQVKAAVDEAKIDEWNDDRYVSLRWNILAPEEYKGRKIFQKIRVFDRDSKKQDKAKRMLNAIAVNAGGGLLKIQSEPTAEDLQKHLNHKPMALLLQVWKIEDAQTGEEKTGNWVSAVSPLKKKSAPKPEPEPEPEIDSDDDFLDF